MAPAGYNWSIIQFFIWRYGEDMDIFYKENKQRDLDYSSALGNSFVKIQVFRSHAY